MLVEVLKKTLLKNISAAAQKVYYQMSDVLATGFPLNTDLVRFSVWCFPIVKQFRGSPAGSAHNIAENMATDDVLQKANATGPYPNLALSPAVLKKGLDMLGVYVLENV